MARTARRHMSLIEAFIEYAFGTSDRYLTMVTHDANGGYRIARLSYYEGPDGRGWDRSVARTRHIPRVLAVPSSRASRSESGTAWPNACTAM